MLENPTISKINNIMSVFKLPRNKTRGFTLIELLVVIAIIGLLSSIVLASLNEARKKGRDARRISDIRQINKALQMYYDDNGYLKSPAEYGENSFSSWDLSNSDDDSDGIYFLDYLVDEGYMSSVPVDPINDSTYYYRYYYWTWDPSYATCDLNWYVVGAQKLETMTMPGNGMACISSGVPGSIQYDNDFYLGDTGL